MEITWAMPLLLMMPNSQINQLTALQLAGPQYKSFNGRVVVGMTLFRMTIDIGTPSTV
jgi:hypothetical protein